MTPEDQTELPQPLTPSTSAKDGRRRLLRGGLAAAPALLTLTTRPVVAGDCFAASAAVSMSSRVSTAVQCTSGKSPASWAKESELANWPAGAIPVKKGQIDATTFNEIFGAEGGFEKKTTLLEVLKLSPSPKNDLAKHVVAAYLNAVSNLTPPGVLDVQRTKAIWTSFATKGFYEPTAGVKWDHNSTIAWIKTTMPL